MSEAVGQEAAVIYYSKHAREFHESYASDPNRLERISVWADVVAIYVRRVALAYDIGCGSGMLTRLAAENADKVIAIDGAKGMLDVAQENLTLAGFTNVLFQQALLPIENTAEYERADLIISSSVLEYLDSLDAAFKCLRALMKPDALLIFSMSNKDSLYRKLVRIIYDFTGKPRYFGLVKHFVDVDSMTSALEAHGIIYLSHKYFGGRDRINRILSAFFPARYSNNMILFVARAAPRI